MYFSGAMGYPNAHYGEGYGAVLIHSIQCTGREQSILECTLSGLVDGDTHMNDAGVMCTGTARIRLCC